MCHVAIPMHIFFAGGNTSRRECLSLSKYPKGSGKPDSTKTAMSLHLEIITPHEGTELGDFGNRLTKSVWHNWLVMMPESAMLGDKGQATIRFQIDKDSSHPATAPTI